MANIWQKLSILAGNLNFGYSYLITTVACFKADCRGLRLKGGFIHDVKKKLSNYLETLNISLDSAQSIEQKSTAEHLETVGISPHQHLQKRFPPRFEKSSIARFFYPFFLTLMLKNQIFAHYFWEVKKDFVSLVPTNFETVPPSLKVAYKRARGHTLTWHFRRPI